VTNTHEMKAGKLCPNCRSSRVHRSHRRKGFDRMLCAIGGQIQRCHDCRARQAWFGSAGFLLPTTGVTGGRLTSLVLLGSTSLVFFLFIWWMISRFTELAG
jgi:hypothetical protein